MFYFVLPSEKSILPHRGVKLVADKMVGIDDQALTSSDSEFTASSGDEDIFELYE